LHMSRRPPPSSLFPYTTLFRSCPVVEGDALRAHEPARAGRVVVAQILADAGQRMTHFDAEITQPLGLPDAGQFQQLGRVDRAGADHHLARRTRLAQIASDRIPDTGAALPVEDEGLR